MWNRIVRGLGWVGGFCLIALLLSAGYQQIASAGERDQFPPPGRLIEVNGSDIHLYCTGQGSPTVILVGGLNSPVFAWGWVQPEIASHTRVCAYDRPGYGWSAPTTASRDLMSLSVELHDLLAASGEKGPYIFAGHSLGAYLVRLYAEQYPRDVVGVVLIDGGSPEIYQAMPADFRRAQQANADSFCTAQTLSATGLLRLLPPSVVDGGLITDLPAEVQPEARALMLYSPDHWGAACREARAFEGSLASIGQQKFPSAVPLRIVWASHLIAPDQPLPDSMPRAEIERIHAGGADRLANLSTRSRVIIADHSDHLIPLHQPQAILDAVLELLTLTTRDRAYAVDGFFT
jgi:pimeloyl-ACP methyl ester carboxylesterase